ELHAYIPLSYTYKILLGGDVRRLHRIGKDYSNQAQMNQSPISRALPFSGQAQLNVLEGSFLGSFGRYEIFVIDSLPPIKEENFSPLKQDYIPSVWFELQESRTTLSNNTNLFDSWEDLNDRTQKRFGSRKLKAHKREVQQLANRLVGNERGQAAKVRSIYYWVQDEMKWNETYALNSKRLDKVLQNRGGNGTEINLLLLHLLRNAGLQAAPVLISTVDNGLVRTYASSLNQFNHILVSVRIQGIEVLLDGLSDVRQLGILPEVDLTQSGYLLDQQGGRWVPLRSQNRLIRHTYSRFSLNEGGQLSGKMLVSNHAYSAVLEKERLQEAGNEEQYLRQHVLSGLNQVELVNPAVNQPQQPEEPLIFSVDLRTDDFVQNAGDVIFVNPLMTKQVTQNPFPEIRRTTPMDLTFPLREAHMLGLRLPKGFELAQIPEPIRVVLPNQGGSFTYNVISMDSIIHISSTIYLNKTIFLPEEYDAVRNFFEYIVNKHEEDLVLRRVAMKEEE
ncbi:MAG: transglutaminase domain-containing protein, partial [Bacteroidota bacterium]